MYVAFQQAIGHLLTRILTIWFGRLKMQGFGEILVFFSISRPDWTLGGSLMFTNVGVFGVSRTLAIEIKKLQEEFSKKYFEKKYFGFSKKVDFFGEKFEILKFSTDRTKWSK